ncbi:MAG: single-stranded DNA-binding protein [Planctomycetes bacterium]|nr:single-stranded DNA-binding protein [Planctomycetota bacterium]
MSNFNRVILAGNLTRDPQLKYLPNNTAVCEFRLAMNRRWRDKDGNQHEDVCFVDVAAFGRQGETINQYMAKGRSILIEGRLKFDQWTAQDGSKRSKLSVVAENFTFLGGPREGGGGPPGGSDYSNVPEARASGNRGGFQQNESRGGSGARQAAPTAQAPETDYSDAGGGAGEPPPTNDGIPF